MLPLNTQNPAQEITGSTDIVDRRYQCDISAKKKYEWGETQKGDFYCCVFGQAEA